MTAVCYRDGVLAADTMVTDAWNNINASTISKMVRMQISGTECVVAFSGEIGAIQDQLLALEYESEAPAGTCEQERCSFIAITKDGRVYTKSAYSRRFRLNKDAFIAHGSALEFLKGALWHGASAVEAVAAAIKGRTDVGGRVMWAKTDGTNWDTIPTLRELFGEL